MTSLTVHTALIIIDVQKGFDDPSWGPRNNPEAETNIARLLTAWRESKRPVIFVQHLSTNPQSPLHPNKPGVAIKEAIQPVTDEPIIQKRVHSAFIGTELEPMLRQQGWGSVVITGMTTDHCVSTTARMAGNLGFATTVVADATATFDRIGIDGSRYPAELVHQISLASLDNQFAQILSTDELLAVM